MSFICSGFILCIFSGTAIIIWLANTVWSTPSHIGLKQCFPTLQLLERELKHPQEVLMKCKYPKCTNEKVLQKQEDKRMGYGRYQSIRTNQTEKKCHIVVSYAQGLYESYKIICSKCGVQVHFKGGNTLKNLLMFPKDRDSVTKRSNIICWLKCGKTGCNDEYIWQPARTFEEQYKEHLKAPSPIFEHQNTFGHTTAVDNFMIIGRERCNMAWAIKEVIYISQQPYPE